MSDIKFYCDKIYSFIRGYGEEYINHFQYQYESVPEATQEQKTPKVEPFKGDIVLANVVGEECARLRNDCFRTIKQNILFNPQAKVEYAKYILEEMSDLLLNHKIHEFRTFFDFIIPEVFVPIIDLFIKQNVNISQVLISCRKNHGDTFCYWLDKYIPEKKEQKVSSIPSIEELFVHKYRPYVPDFIEQLEKGGIIKNNIYICSRKNYLARLLLYMQEKGFIQSQKKITQWKCYYEYFGIRVVEKREDGTDSNIVTRSNLEKGQDKNFSDQEMKDFALICSIFISRRE